MPSPKENKTAPPLPGAEPLKAHIERLDMSIPQWCEEKGLDRFTVQKLLNGTLQRVSVQVAFDIERATEEQIKWSLWIPTSQVRNEQRERRSAVARQRARDMRRRGGKSVAS